MMYGPLLHLYETIILLEGKSKPWGFVEVKGDHSVSTQGVEFDPEAEGDVGEVGRGGVEEGGAGGCEMA